MFDITSDDIALLNDEDLRALVGCLCEAEMRRRALPVSAVTWGGDQNAADGGLDVRVDLPSGSCLDGFIPRATTGFQVKKEDMPPAKIPKEMRPGGVLRPVIKELSEAAGAYIIVSSGGSTADIALARRRRVMALAVSDLPEANRPFVDFYDRSRVATWLRDHPGLVPWVRQKIGKAISGWRSYGPWAGGPEEGSAEYLVDAALRLRSGSRDGEAGLPAVAGMERVRDILQTPGTVVRCSPSALIGQNQRFEEWRISGSS